MTILTLAAASVIIDQALAHGAAAGMAPLAVSILDAGGHLLALKRDERASLYRADIATAKARSCLGMGFGGRELARRAQAAPGFYAALGSVAPMLPVPGGVLIRDTVGLLLGAIGISGDTGDNDERCAVAGILAADLRADTGGVEFAKI